MMKKKIVSMGLAVMMCMSLCISASAANSSKDSDKSPVIVNGTDCSIWSTIFENNNKYRAATWIQTDDNSVISAGSVKIQSFMYDSTGELDSSSESVLQSDYNFHVAYTDFRAASDYAYGNGIVNVKNSAGSWKRHDTEDTPYYYLQKTMLIDSLKDTLRDGKFPQNSYGETYGSMMMKDVTGQIPEMIAAKGYNGESGYVKQSDLLADSDAVVNMKHVGRVIPLYDLNGNEIGTFMVRFNDSTEIIGMNMDEVRAKLEDGRIEDPILWDLAEKTLINGAYPTNADGETYGHPKLRKMVGYMPDLIQASNEDGLRGYVRHTDEPIMKMSDNGEKKYVCPLYDQNGGIIGEFEVGGADAVQMAGKTISEVSRDLNK